MCEGWFKWSIWTRPVKYLTCNPFRGEEDRTLKLREKLQLGRKQSAVNRKEKKRKGRRKRKIEEEEERKGKGRKEIVTSIKCEKFNDLKHQNISWTKEVEMDLSK